MFLLRAGVQALLELEAVVEEVVEVDDRVLPIYCPVCRCS